MRCLILGGGGFIGSHLADRLLSCGYTVRIFERPRVPYYRTFLKEEKVEWQTGDFQSEADVASSVDGCDIVFHLISTTLPKGSNDDPIYDIESNVIGTLKLLSSTVRYSVKKIIFISSGGTIYGNPNKIPVPETHPTEPLVSYGISKLTIEKFLHLYNQLHGLDYAILRVANPFGERQRVSSAQGAVTAFLSKALAGETIEIWGDGNVTRDYIYINDVIDAFLMAMNHIGEPRIFNIGAGQGRSLNDLIDIIEDLFSRPMKRRYISARKFDVPVSVLDITRSKEVLGWQPKTTFRDGLMLTYDWLKRN